MQLKGLVDSDVSSKSLEDLGYSKIKYSYTIFSQMAAPEQRLLLDDWGTSAISN
jgi:hypothetical protein